MKFFNSIVPSRCLFDSSVSPFRMNPSNEHRSALIDVRLYEVFCRFCGELRGVSPMIFWIDCPGHCHYDSTCQEAKCNHCWQARTITASRKLCDCKHVYLNLE